MVKGEDEVMRVLRDEESVSGPTGETDNALGELAIIVTTSASRLLESFLSTPASLPVVSRRG